MMTLHVSWINGSTGSYDERGTKHGYTGKVKEIRKCKKATKSGRLSSVAPSLCSNSKWLAFDIFEKIIILKKISKSIYSD